MMVTNKDSTMKRFCRYHGYCRDKGISKVKCTMDKCKTCKYYKKFQEEMEQMRIGGFRER